MRSIPCVWLRAEPSFVSFLRTSRYSVLTGLPRTQSGRGRRSCPTRSRQQRDSSTPLCRRGAQPNNRGAQDQSITHSFDARLQHSISTSFVQQIRIRFAARSKQGSLRRRGGRGSTRRGAGRTDGGNTVWITGVRRRTRIAARSSTPFARFRASARIVLPASRFTRPSYRSLPFLPYSTARSRSRNVSSLPRTHSNNPLLLRRATTAPSRRHSHMSSGSEIRRGTSDFSDSTSFSSASLDSVRLPDADATRSRIVQVSSARPIPSYTPSASVPTLSNSRSILLPSVVPSPVYLRTVRLSRQRSPTRRSRRGENGETTTAQFDDLRRRSETPTNTLGQLSRLACHSQLRCWQPWSKSGGLKSEGGLTVLGSSLRRDGRSYLVVSLRSSFLCRKSFAILASSRAASRIRVRIACR